MGCFGTFRLDLSASDCLVFCMSPFSGLSAKNVYFKYTYALGIVECTPAPWAGFVVTGSALYSLR